LVLVVGVVVGGEVVYDCLSCLHGFEAGLEVVSALRGEGVDSSVWSGLLLLPLAGEEASVFHAAEYCVDGAGLYLVGFG